MRQDAVKLDGDQAVLLLRYLDEGQLRPPVAVQAHRVIHHRGVELDFREGGIVQIFLFIKLAVAVALAQGDGKLLVRIALMKTVLRRAHDVEMGEALGIEADPHVAVALPHPGYRDLPGRGFLVDLHQDLLRQVDVGHVGQFRRALDGGGIAQETFFGFPVFFLFHIDGIVNQLLHKIPLHLYRLVLGTEVDAGVAQGAVLVDQLRDFPGIAPAGAVDAGIFVGAHPTMDAGFRVDEQFGIGKSPGIFDVDTMLQVRLILLLLRQGMIDVERAFLHHLPHAVDELALLRRGEAERLLEGFVSFDQVEHVGQRDVGGADPGAVVAAGAHQESQRLFLRDGDAVGNAVGGLAPGNRGGQSQQAKYVAGGADPFATVAFGAGAVDRQQRRARGFQARRHHGGEDRLVQLPEQPAGAIEREAVMLTPPLQQLHPEVEEWGGTLLEQL